MTKALTLKKSLGQHFLHDELICREIIRQIDQKPDLQLLEIGPGGGALSKYLLKWKDTRYQAIEVDEEKVDFLLKTYPEIHGKILHIDFLHAPPPFEGDFTIIGNFPYNISSQILFRILDWEDQVSEMVGMFQKEVAQRVAAKEGNKTYGILSVLIQAYYTVEYLFDVPASAFNPPPKVVSGVIRLSRTGNPYQIANRKNFARLVKAGFNQRRKTLRNALKGTLPPEALKAEIFSKRAEQLSVSDFVSLYKTYLPEQK
jgi:16S rRNA (adenine1518-N6/adenine1519-N6)-dimethyltransferase